MAAALLPGLRIFVMSFTLIEYAESVLPEAGKETATRAFHKDRYK